MKINMHTSHPSAFISSTFIDLQKERESVAGAFESKGLNVNALDIKPASTDTSKNEILNGIRESDFVILLIGDRYGSILPEMTGSKSLSITWWEYQRACAFGKPVLVYFKMDNIDAINGHDDKNDEAYERKRKLFERFKKIILKKHNPAYFSDIFDLSEKIQNVIIPTYRSGVKTLNITNSKLSLKISELETEIEKLNTLNKLKSGINKEPQPKPQTLGLGGLGYTVAPTLGNGITQKEITSHQGLQKLGKSRHNE